MSHRHYAPCFTSHDPDVFRDDGMGHYRSQYRIILMLGMHVTFNGKPGTITGCTTHLIIRPDVPKYPGERWFCHPTWHLVGYPTPGQEAESEARRRAYLAVHHPSTLAKEVAQS